MVKKIVYLLTIFFLVSCTRNPSTKNSSTDLLTPEVSSTTITTSNLKSPKFLFKKNNAYYEYNNLKSNFTEVSIGSKRILGNDKDKILNSFNDIKLEKTDSAFNKDKVIELNFSKENSSATIKILIDNNNIIRSNNFEEINLVNTNFIIKDMKINYSDLEKLFTNQKNNR